MRYKERDGVWIKEEDEESFKKIDTLILDIDGVLIDVTESFRETISITIFEVLKKAFKLRGEERPLLPSDVKLFKQRKGFNNDWELTQSAIIFFLTYILKGVNDFSELIQKKKDLPRWLDQVERNGAGLTGCLKYFGRMQGERGKMILRKVPFELTKKIFQEVYAGKENCLKLYGFKPKFFTGKGLIEKEKLILSKKDLEPFRKKIGLITGRTREEAEYVLEKYSLKDLFSPKAIIVDDGTFPSKPHPEALIFLTELLKSKVAVYIGDSFDDWLMVKEFAKIARRKKVLSAIVVEKEEWEKYISEGASIISGNSREIVKFLVKGRYRIEEGRDKKKD